jgi:hypothetical protein
VIIAEFKYFLQPEQNSNSSISSNKTLKDGHTVPLLLSAALLLKKKFVDAFRLAMKLYQFEGRYKEQAA